MHGMEEEAPVIFPNSRSILWSREPTAKPHYINAEDVMPPLFLSPSAMISLVESCSKSVGNAKVVEKVASIVPVGNVLEDSSRAREGDFYHGPWRTLLGNSAYVINLSDIADSTAQPMSSLVGPSVHSNLTIPIILRSDWEDSLDFDKDSTSNLVNNLGKSITNGRDCTMRSCLRVRAACSTRSCNGIVESSLRFEAIMPNASYQVVKIRNLPLLLTPLTINLTKQNGRDARVSGPKMGYLTLNQTRKVVPMLESDTASSVSPIVGVWVCLDEPQSGAAFPNIFLNHPFLWGACTRFLHNTNIGDRVYIDTDTFLLANFGSESVSFFEVTKLAPANRQGTFTCCDFSVDLSLDKANYNVNAMEPVVCKFRPLSQAEQIVSFREATGDNKASSSSDAPSIASVPPDDMTSEQIRSAARMYIEQAKERDEDAEGEDGTWSEGNTPMPRTVAPVKSAPSSPAKETSSAHVLEVRDSGSRLVSSSVEPKGTINGNAASFAALSKSYHGQPRYPNAFPAELILAQQMQLDDLRAQVAQLQEMVLTLSCQAAMKESHSGTESLVAGSVSPMPPAPPGPSSAGTCEGSKKGDGSAAKGPDAKSSSGDDNYGSEVDSGAPGGTVESIKGTSSGDAGGGDNEMEKENEEQNSVMSVVEAEAVSVASLDDRLKKLRSSYSRVNPLSSAASNHPVLRVHPDEEQDLMEPSVLKQKGFGESAFPGPTLDVTLVNEVGDLVGEDLDSDEDTLKSLDLLTEEMSSGVGKHFMVAPPAIEETPSMLETESLVAIQAKYA